MTAFLARAAGAPGPTLVLDAAAAPGEDDALLSHLSRVRRGLRAGAVGDVLKLALISAASHPMFDLDYRFVQGLPAGVDQFDTRGSCGHSILAAVLAAERLGLVQPLWPGTKTRVRVLNNGDHVVCETDSVVRDGATFTVHFLAQPRTRMASLLTTGQPAGAVAGGPNGQARASQVSMGNPYLFVDATDLGVRSQEALFADDPALFDVLDQMRMAAAVSLGWPPSGAFPKIAAIGRFHADRLSARALTVTGWHPGIALTGATCLATATAIPGTVPNRLWPEGARGRVLIETTNGATEARCATTGSRRRDHLLWTSVPGKQARFVGPLVRQPLHHHLTERITVQRKDTPCLLTTV